MKRMPVFFTLLLGVVPVWAQDSQGDALPPDHESRPPYQPQTPGDKDRQRAADDLDSWLESDRLTGDWFGARTFMEENIGLSIEPWWVMDASTNYHGGLDTEKTEFRHLFGVDFTLDMETAVGLEGGTFFVQFMNHNGPDASQTLTGDFQVFGNIDADGRTQVAELWYEQWFGDFLRIKIGKVEANSEFAFADNGVEFLHSSAGFPPTILGFPSYPDPATSVNVFVYPTSWSYIGFGSYDGALQNGILTGSRGPSTMGHEDWFWISEGGITWEGGDRGLDGRLALGGWYHSGNFDRFETMGRRRTTPTQQGTEGWYTILDQTLWRENPATEDDEQGIKMYASYAHADPDVSEVDHNVNLGVIWTGLIPERNDDIVGAGMNYVHFTQSGDTEFVSHEAAYELFYKLQLTPAIAIKPDIQYIHSPGGEGLSDACVGTLRIELTF